MKSTRPIYPDNFCELRTCGEPIIPKKTFSGRWQAVCTFVKRTSCDECIQELRKQRNEDLKKANLKLPSAFKLFTGV